MFPNNNISPLPNYHFKSSQTVFDMVYNPVETVLLKSARLYDAVCISGLDMFIVQGLRQIELLLNKTIISSELIFSLKKMLTKHQIISRG